MPSEFGSLLRKHRERSSDRFTGHKLTQERLAELMEVSVGTINNWEKDRRQIHAEERPLLLKLLETLHESGGLSTVSEADELLHAGGYRGLTEAERSQHLPGLIVEENDDMTTPPNLQQRLAGSPIASTLFGPEWPQDESRLAAAVLAGLGYPANRFNAGQGLRLAIVLLIWIFSAAIWSQALQWPYARQADMVQSWLIWAAMTVAAPVLLGLAVKADRQDNLVTTTGASRSIAVIRATGALAGHVVGAAIVLLVVLALFYLDLWPLSRWLVAGLAGLPLLIGYSAARRMPLNHFRAFSERRGEENAFHLEEGDWVMLLAFFVLGPALAGIFAVGQPWAWHPLVGAGMIGFAFAGAAALQVLAQRMGESVVPAEVFALLLGLPLGLQLAIQPGVEPLLGLGLIAGLTVLAVRLRRQKEIPSALQMFGLLGLLAGIWVLLELNVWAGRMGALAGIWIAWRWLGDLFRLLAPFWLVVLLLVGCLVLLETTDLPAWVIRGGFGVGTVGLGVWAWRRAAGRRNLEPMNDDRP